MKSYRIGIAFIYHESNTFSSIKTNLSAFFDGAYHIGPEILKVYHNTKTEAGGFIDRLEQEQSVEIVPLLCAAATPSGMLTKKTFEHIESEMLAILHESLPLDGLLVALHGAMVAEDVFDPEARLLGKIRRVVGNIPIATTLDMHANLSKDMIDYTPLHFGFKTYPHIDMYEQGVNAAHTLLQNLKNNHHEYHASLIKLPMLPPSINMRTETGPMNLLVELAKELEQTDDIINASVFGGFPYSDIPMAGASVLVIARSKSKAENAAKLLAQRFWQVRNDFLVELPTIQEAIEMALHHSNMKPIALVDISDNPLSGGSGDTTALLQELINAKIRGCLFGAMTDPESIDKCIRAGVGMMVMLELGGKTYPSFGEPVRVLAKVIRLSDGIYYNSGPMNTNLKVDLKGAAHIEVDGVSILLIGRPMSANDPEMFRHIGIEPTCFSILALKAKNHFLAAFEPIISKAIAFDAPGVATNNLRQLSYRHVPEDRWPFVELEFEV